MEAETRSNPAKRVKSNYSGGGTEFRNSVFHCMVCAANKPSTSRNLLGITLGRRMGERGQFSRERKTNCQYFSQVDFYVKV